MVDVSPTKFGQLALTGNCRVLILTIRGITLPHGNVMFPHDKYILQQDHLVQRIVQRPLISALLVFSVVVQRGIIAVVVIAVVGIAMVRVTMTQL